VNPGPYLVVMVEGPSEWPEDVDRSGVVRSIVAEVFGEEIARETKPQYWAHIPISPLRGAGSSGLTRDAERVRRVIRLAHEMTAYGAIIVRDNDGPHRDRLSEVRAGVEASQAAHRAAVGVARQMIEAWLLADDGILNVPLPAGKAPEDLWGEKKDPSSNYPKHVLRRCCLDLKHWAYHEAIAAWSASRARSNAPSLDDFVREVEQLADRQGAR
jgi:hypothetical protein